MRQLNERGKNIEVIKKIETSRENVKRKKKRKRNGVIIQKNI